MPQKLYNQGLGMLIRYYVRTDRTIENGSTLIEINDFCNVHRNDPTRKGCSVPRRIEQQWLSIDLEIGQP